LRIVHRWTEDGQARQFQAPPGRTAYEVSCGKNPTGHTIEMSLPSRWKIEN